MAIRLEHQPIGISGVAAYAAGSGRRKERDRKYATDIIQNQQARADKYNLQANQQQFFIGRDRERAGVEAAADVRRNALRIGEINLADMKARERDEARAKTMTEMDALDFSRSEFGDRRDYARSTLSKLPPVPEYAPADVRRNLEKSRSAISEMSTSAFNVEEPDTGSAFNDAVRSYYTDLESIPKPSRADEFNKDTAYLDQTGTAYDEPGEGRTPFSISTGKPRFDPVKPVETVPFRGQQVPVDRYQDHVKGVRESQKQWDKGYSSAVTPEERSEFEGKFGQRPQSPPSVMDLQYPQETPNSNPGIGGLAEAIQRDKMLPPVKTTANSGLDFQAAMLNPRPQASMPPEIQEAMAAANSGDPNAQRALDERGIQWRKKSTGERR